MELKGRAKEEPPRILRGAGQRLGPEEVSLRPRDLQRLELGRPGAQPTPRRVLSFRRRVPALAGRLPAPALALDVALRAPLRYNVLLHNILYYNIICYTYNMTLHDMV